MGITALWKMADCCPDPMRTLCRVAGMPLVAFPILLSCPFSLDDEGSRSKRPKVELSEEELKAHVSKGTLGKLTVPTLKEACRVYGLKGGLKKQELLDTLTRHFQA